MKNQSLISKMVLFNFIGIAAAMLIVLTILSILYTVFSRHTLADNVSANARLLASNTAPMLAFNDQQEASSLAAIFQETNQMQRVLVFDYNHEIFADVASNSNTLPLPLIENHLIDITTTTTIFEDDCLLAFAPVTIHETRLGTVVLESSLTSIRDNIILFISVGILATFFGVFLSAFILKKLQLWALAPIIDISNIAEQVATKRDYSLRVDVAGSDEISRLGNRFNQMLDKIEMWEKNLSDEIRVRRKSERHLDQLARTDQLTQSSNRLAFIEDIKLNTEKAQQDNQLMALMLVDLDNFKEVNDNHGHPCGDTVLQVTSERLTAILRESDNLYRLGGDEFAIILGELTSTTEATVLGERIIAKVGERIVIRDSSQKITVTIGASVGIAFFPTNASSPEDLVRRADLAMYSVKKAGKNAVCLFHNSMENCNVHHS